MREDDSEKADGRWVSAVSADEEDTMKLPLEIAFENMPHSEAVAV